MRTAAGASVHHSKKGELLTMHVNNLYPLMPHKPDMRPSMQHPARTKLSLMMRQTRILPPVLSFAVLSSLLLCTPALAGAPHTLAGAGSDISAQDAGDSSQSPQIAAAGSTDSASTAAGSTDADGSSTFSPDDEIVTVLGSHSTLTNESVAEEYEWVKINLAGEFMPYVISHAEGNPNVIHFLYLDGHDVESPESFSYTDEERSRLLPLLGDNVTGLVPLLMQWDYRWGFDHYGGGPAGLTACAPTCMTMIGFGLTGDESINPRDMFLYSENSGYWVSGQGTSWDLVLNAFPDHNISGMRISADQGTITSELRAGHPVLINVGVGKFSAVGHFMVLAGVLDDGSFILNDPNNLENCSKTWTWSELGSEVMAAWSYHLA